MKYINTYPDANAYNSASATLSKPHVGYIIADNEVKYAPYIDYSKEYLTFEALESGTFTLTVPAAVDSTYMTSVSYSTDDGANWSTTQIDNTAQTITTPTINAGDKVLWKGEGSRMSNSISNNNNSRFSSTGNFNVSGNIMSMLYGDNFQNKTSFASGSVCVFGCLFFNCSKLINAENLILPATTLAEKCYQYLFGSCTSLTTVPELPATTLANYCYSNMFQGCTGLMTVPTLPATTMANYCYNSMFSGCTSLTTPPVLPATTLASNCYNQMFNGCTALTTVPTLPATTLASNCYDSMFQDCTALTTVPALPATTLATNCYTKMFNGCRLLTTVPSNMLPATTLADICYKNMFQNCSALTTAPTLPATTLAQVCYGGMFFGCTNLNSITMLATDISATNCLSGWVNGVAATGTFTKAASMTTLPTGVNGIPENWTVVDA